MSESERPERCETDGCRREVRRRVEYYAKVNTTEESGPTYRCEPCATAFQEGSLAGRSDTTVNPLPTASERDSA